MFFRVLVGAALLGAVSAGVGTIVLTVLLMVVSGSIHVQMNDFLETLTGVPGIGFAVLGASVGAMKGITVAGLLNVAGEVMVGAAEWCIRRLRR
ncbi:hypothetical protein [Oleispirillum naphthae]|uniref:hypothetical protein n=1 Tax=Oleispirillum naphthae TaxID=2838853 RepID=UPI0030824E12